MSTEVRVPEALWQAVLDLFAQHEPGLEHVAYLDGFRIDETGYPGASPDDQVFVAVAHHHTRRGPAAQELRRSGEGGQRGRPPPAHRQNTPRSGQARAPGSSGSALRRTTPLISASDPAPSPS